MNKKRESSPKAKTIKSLLDPATEKRLIGELKPPKRHLSYSENIPKFKQLVSVNLSPPKAANDLSKLNSVQTFIKDFLNLEHEVHNLRQLSCPPNSDKIFAAVAEIHDGLANFDQNCKTITKQKKLHAEINPKAFQFYKSFVVSVDFFIEKLELYKKQIHNSYSHTIRSKFHKIEKNVNKFFDICGKDPQVRTIAVQYRKYCDDSVKDIKDILKPYLEQEEFNYLNDEQLEKFSETTKTFGRFFEKELYPLIASSINPRFSISEYIEIFHECFVEIVPMITSAPFFIDQYKIILEKLEIVKKDIKKVKKEVGDERILKIKVDKSKEVKVEVEHDDIKPALNELVKYFEPKITDYDKDSDILVKIKEAAEDKIGKLKSEIKSLEDKIEDMNNKRPVDIATEQYKRQFSDIKKLKKDLEDKLREENANFNRSIIYSIRNILTNPKHNTSDTQIHQVQSLITQCKEEMDSVRSESDKIKGDFSKTKDILSQIYESTMITEDEPLNHLASNVVTVVNEERKNASDSINSLKQKLKENSDEISKMLASSFGVETADEEFSEKVEITKKQIATLVEELRRSRAESASANASLKEVGEKLSEVTGKQTNLDSTIDSIKKLIENIDDELKDGKKLQKSVFDFVVDVSKNLTIPEISPPKDFSESKVTMNQISNSLENPHQTASLIMDSMPNSGLFKNAAAYKQLALDIACRVLGNNRSDFSGQKFDDIKKSVFDRVEYYEGVVNLALTIDRIEKESQQSTDFMKKIKDEVDNSRKTTQSLATVHDILKNMSNLISGEMVFLPKTNELKTMKKFSDKMKELQISDNEALNAVIQDVIEFNNTLCKQISKGKFSPDRNQDLIMHNEKLENEIFKLKEKLIEADIEFSEDEKSSSSSSSSNSSSEEEEEDKLASDKSDKSDKSDNDDKKEDEDKSDDD